MLTIFTVLVNNADGFYGTQETTFISAKTAEFSLCGYSMTQTEHPKLFILETQRGRTFKARSKISVKNLDIFSMSIPNLYM